MRPTAVAVLVIFTLALTACAGQSAGQSAGESAGTSDQVLPAEDVYGDSPPEITVDPSGTFATLEVTTTLDMACAVVFGTTEALGDGVAVDADMGGGAHATHAAVMSGLQPDTEYFYRVQGSGADGALYRSELATFRTPAAAPSEALGPNVALDAEVRDVSSEFSDDFAAGLAIDGDLATEWSSAGDGDDATITLDLGGPVDLVGIGFRSRAMSDGTAIIETYTLTLDGTELGSFPAGEGLVVSELDATGQVLRIDAETTTGGNTGAAEIEVYGSTG